MKSLTGWLDEYSASHRHPLNKRLHWLCVPLIAYAVLCALKAIPLGGMWLNAATVFGVLALLYYLALSWRLAAGMSVLFVVMYALVLALEAAAGPRFFAVAAVIFVLAWIGQFIGHHYEGKRPSFFKDLQFLLIGPLWLLAAAYRRADWRLV